jgi:aspartate/methionine/tyrosine aminotransferase
VLHDPNKIYDNLVATVNADALFIIEPNNPTGFTLEGTGQDIGARKNSYSELIRYAKDHNKLLIFDFCFSPFLLEDAQSASFDVYKELEESGVRYIIIEDTGKTWPLQDAKVAMLKMSKGLYQDLFDIHTSYLLNVSPFILNLVTQYVIDSEQDHFHSVLSLLKKNREIARNILNGSILEMQESMANVSVAWFKITHPTITATDLHAHIRKQGVYILPGTYFFWSDHTKGERFMRIALARDSDYFEKAARKLRTILDQI